MAFPVAREGERTIGVALPVPEPWGSQLQGYRASVGDPLAAAIPTHVTLLPPTAVGEDRLGVVEEHLLAVASRADPFRMRLRGTATFRPLSPVVFVSVVQGISSCERLASKVLAGPLERRLAFPYHPHVTVAHDLSEAVLDRAFEELATFDATFEMRAFALYEHGSDRVWRPQRDFMLGGPLPGPVPA